MFDCVAMYSTLFYDSFVKGAGKSFGAAMVLVAAIPTFIYVATKSEQWCARTTFEARPVLTPFELSMLHAKLDSMEQLINHAQQFDEELRRKQGHQQDKLFAHLNDVKGIVEDISQRVTVIERNQSE